MGALRDRDEGSRAQTVAAPDLEAALPRLDIKGDDCPDLLRSFDGDPQLIPPISGVLSP